MIGRLADPTVVRIGDTSIKVRHQGGDRWVFEMPPAEEPGSVRFIVESGEEQVALASFVFTAPPAPEPAPTTPAPPATAQPEPSPSGPVDPGPFPPFEFPCEIRPRECIEIPERPIRIPDRFVKPKGGVLDRGEILRPLEDVRLDR